MQSFTHFRRFILLAMVAAVCSCGEPRANPKKYLPDIDAIFFERSDISLGEEYKVPKLSGYHNEDKLTALLDGNYLRTWRAGFAATEGASQLLAYQVVSNRGEPISEQRAIPLVGPIVDFDLVPLAADRWIASAVTLSHIDKPAHTISTFLLSGTGEVIDQQQSSHSGIFTSADYFRIIRATDPSCVSLLLKTQAQRICIDKGDTLVTSESSVIPLLDTTKNYVWHHKGKNFVYTAERRDKRFNVQVYDARWRPQGASIELGQNIYNWDSTHIEERNNLVLISWLLNEGNEEDYEWVLFDGSDSNTEPLRGRLKCTLCGQSKVNLPSVGLVPLSRQQFILAWQSHSVLEFPQMREGFNLVLFDWQNQWNSQPLFVPIDPEEHSVKDWSVAVRDNTLLLSWLGERTTDIEERSYSSPDRYRKSKGIAFELIFPQTDVPAHGQILKAEHWRLSLDKQYQQAADSFFAGRFVDARERFKHTADLGDRRAEYAYSRMLMHGLGGEQDIKTGKAVIDRLIADENPAALAARANDRLLHRTLGIERDERWGNYAAAVGSAEAQLMKAFDQLAAQRHYLGFDDSKIPLVYQWLHNAAVYGDPTSQYLLAAWLHQGLATAVDHDTSEKWLKRAADNGLSQAQFELRLPASERFFNIDMSDFTLPETPERARLIASAESGNPASMVNLASNLFRDDPESALAWLQKAHDANFAPAAALAGYLLSSPGQPASNREQVAFWFHSYLQNLRQFLTDQQVMEKGATWEWAIAVLPETTP